MPNIRSNEYWEKTDLYEPFETRAHRFRDEMRPVFYRWLGIAPEARILDAGCGTGVFTRYLAAGLTTGHITGADINKVFIEYGKQKSRESGLSGKMTLDIADGYHLPYADETFDAVTNYTYVGVLADPEAGFREMTRVCKQGGVVSCVIATNSFTKPAWHGDYPFDPDRELQRLADRESEIFALYMKKRNDSYPDELMLYKRLGYKNIHLYPFGHMICYSDTNLPLEYRKKIALDEAREEIGWLKSRYDDNAEIYNAHGFTIGDYNRMAELLEAKLKYLSDHFDMDESYEWHGGFNYIVAAKKN